MKKRLISALLAVTALISTGMCIGCTDAAIDTSSSKVEKEQELTDAEKKAILRGEFSKYFQNDLREILPFSDIIGLPLADLKTAVDTSNNWAVETSVHVNHVKDDEIVYSFSNRELHI